MVRWQLEITTHIGGSSKTARLKKKHLFRWCAVRKARRFEAIMRFPDYVEVVEAKR